MKIDVHHHFYPQAFREALEAAGGDPSGWYIPPWTLELDQEINTTLNVTTTILSVTAPGPVIAKEPAAAASLARECNRSAAAIRDASPAQYGFFASVPSLFDTALALEEIRYALDELHADGVTLFTRYGQGPNYLGHEAFAPIWAELSRRQAVVFIHPTHPQDTALINRALPQPMFDYPHETGRTAMDLLTSGRLRQHRGCRVILSHAGGTLPYLIHRAATMLPCMPPDRNIGLSRDEILDTAREVFYFDTAISANEVTLSALARFAKPGHILFGSDFPNAPRDAIVQFTRFVEEEAATLPDGVTVEALKENALQLFPRLKRAEANGVSRI
ncbi:amidohydrolase family protein [Aspergillus brunneoviolaceus CBS 621.78]|uniref:6-methylsalicylate decarboxylase n=2 Tax=Aspergillus TaxID=5052 RepID=A0A8G1W684_9EURO|nr:amidohydrolase family protein [Aspergillus brunneoviolaceus CBS 621.78]XP_040806019.1 amidohydrolase family protein [Aspergillus fijiensis CBS 313.89]RAH43067.1 amidohydrolase family protein [Aspergillus brunneoviolaceus CBS 621.78]RAK82009.1 amidohydrolase family protein [Aspergillus fijiensis CBS 313.89]